MISTFRRFLTEDKEGKNVHLNHLEDLIFIDGVSGARKAISFLKSLRDMLALEEAMIQESTRLTVKFDGAPAIICGPDPKTKKFFVGTKGVFAGNSKQCFSSKDIQKFYSGQPALAAKLQACLDWLPLLEMKQVIQGDLMFSKGDIKKKMIDGNSYITFQPNTILYAVEADTPLASRMLEAEIGIVFHTTYTGSSIATMKASFGVDIGRLKMTKKVWFRDASFTDATGVATLNTQEQESVSAYLSQAGSIFANLNSGVLNRIASTETLRIPLLAYINAKVRAGEEIGNTRQFVADFIQATEARHNQEIQSVKQEKAVLNRETKKNEVLGFWRTNKDQVRMMMDMHDIITRAKKIIIRKLEQVQDIGTFISTPDGYKVTAPEGFVAIDISGQAVKLVDRLEFSHANFTVDKEWKK